MKKFCHLLLLLTIGSTQIIAQGTETFINIPTVTPSSYLARTWTGDNGLTWNATDARTDQTITGKAITIRNGSVTCTGIPNGVGTLSFSHVQFFTGSNPVLEVYINNILIGTANPTATAATATFSNINVGGAFSLEIRQVTSGLRIGIDDVTWTSFGGTPCSEPTSQPTNLQLSSTPTTVSGSFTVAVPVPDEYLIIRSTSASLSVNPVDGTTYTAGQVIGNGVVVQFDAINTFTDNGLTPSTTYYYFVFADNSQNCSGGPNYLTTSPLTLSATTPAVPPCTAPSAAATSLQLAASASSISGSFTAAAGANRYLVVRSLTNSLSASPVNGTVYTTGQSFGGGTIVSYSSATSFAAGGLNPTTTYYFFVFAASGDCTGEPFYNNTALTGSAITTNGFNDAAYYATATGTCQTLKTNLKNIISANTTVLSYTPGLWNAYYYTDQHRNDANTATIIWDMYSDNPAGAEPYTYTWGTNQCGSYSGEGNCYNREHSMPQSYFNSAEPMVSDLHHIFPVDGKVNGERNNYPYGEVTSPTITTQNGSKLGTGNNFGYTATVFEPRNEYKGDFARAQLYMAVRYEDVINTWYSNGSANDVLLSPADQPNAVSRKLQVFDDWYIQLLYKWHLQDPVSQKEIDRNNAIYDTLINDGGLKKQGNRNPFVDHPEFVSMIWQCSVIPVTLIDFKATKTSNAIMLQWYATRETNFKQYIIERSINGINYTAIGTVAGQNLANYSFSDDKLPDVQTIYYRLKLIDIDESFNYSKIVSVRLNKLFDATVYPNPAKDLVTLKLQSAPAANGTMIISDITGRTVKQQRTSGGQSSIETDIRYLPSGRYFIKLVTGQQVITQSFMIYR
ncbi:MAG: endonuclease [Ferruginibacter sp.]